MFLLLQCNVHFSHLFYIIGLPTRIECRNLDYRSKYIVSDVSDSGFEPLLSVYMLCFAFFLFINRGVGGFVCDAVYLRPVILFINGGMHVEAENSSLIVSI